MPDLDEINPFPEDEPDLRQAWKDGYRAGATLKKESNVRLDDDSDPIAEAYRRGFEAGQRRRDS